MGGAHLGLFVYKTLGLQMPSKKVGTGVFSGG